MARNKYQGQCYVCGLLVKPGTGHFEKAWSVEGPYWKTKHANIPGDGRVTCDMAREELPCQIADLHDEPPEHYDE